MVYQNGWAFTGVSIKSLKNDIPTSALILNRFCNTQKAIKECEPLAPVEFMIHHNIKNDLLIIGERHTGTLLID